MLYCHLFTLVHTWLEFYGGKDARGVQLEPFSHVLFYLQGLFSFTGVPLNVSLQL